jgi:hypothetical protein
LPIDCAHKNFGFELLKAWRFTASQMLAFHARANSQHLLQVGSGLNALASEGFSIKNVTLVIGVTMSSGSTS